MATTPHARTVRNLAARRHRFAAFLIDSLICSIAVLPIHPLPVEGPEVSDESVLISYLNPYAGSPGWRIEVAVTVLFTAYFWRQHALWGQTLGK
ncbi:hypothetical protein, partial [Micromonospora harpali]